MLMCVMGALCMLSCQGDLSQNSDPLLTLSTNIVNFTLPSEVGGVSSAELIITNVGQVDVIISDLSLEESDETPEITLLDAADWMSESVTLQPEESRTLRLQWAPSNAVRDEGELIITSNAGTFEVELSTPDIDPVLSVYSEAQGALDITQGELILAAVEAELLVSDRVQIRSNGLAPLRITKLCFIDSDNSCLSAIGEVGRGQLSLCRSLVDNECEPYELDQSLSLNSGEEHSFLS